MKTREIRNVNSNSENVAENESVNYVDYWRNSGFRYLPPVQSTGPTDFSAFAVLGNFEHSVIDCSNKTVIGCVEVFVQCHFIDPKRKSVKQYKSLVNYLREVEKLNHFSLMPCVIGSQFMEQFENYLVYKNLAPNTIASIIGKLKTVMRWACKYGARTVNDFDSYYVKRVNSKPLVVLTQDEIQRIYWFNIDCLPISPQLKKTYTKVRDHFVLSCFIGQSFLESIKITSSNFRGADKETFYAMHHNTCNSSRINFPRFYGDYPCIVKDILEKYEFKAPWTGDLSDFNKHLKKVCEYVGLNKVVEFQYKTKGGRIVQNNYKKYELINSSVARRSFIYNAIKREVNPLLIKMASGLQSDFSIYKYNWQV